MESFLPVPAGSDFPLHNLPWGVFSVPGAAAGSEEERGRRRIGVAIGESVVDVSALAARGLLAGRGGASPGAPLSFSSCLDGRDGLNPFLALGKPAWSEARWALTSLLRSSEGVLRDNEGLRKEAIFDLREIESRLPMRVGDFTDFYASREHATNCGCLFRDPENALQPNWTSLPVGYHGENFVFPLSLSLSRARARARSLALSSRGPKKANKKNSTNQKKKLKNETRTFSQKRPELLHRRLRHRRPPPSGPALQWRLWRLDGGRLRARSGGGPRRA